jgi:Na+-transporting methylmalonyl-CoA/oxaloacetate decarboxylase beta subunit
MNLSSFLTPETISTYLVFFLGVIFTAVGFIVQRRISRKQPKLLKLLKIDQVSILEVNPKIKGDLEIQFKSIPIKSLYLTTFTLQNSSEETLDNILLKIIVSKPNSYPLCRAG